MKDNSKRMIFTLTLILIIFSIFFILKVYKPSYKIILDGQEVNNLTACCIEIKNIDYFENYSNLINNGRTDTAIHLEKRELCVSEKENLVGLNCKQISKEELSTKWLLDNFQECLVDNEYWVKSNEFGIISKEDCEKYKFGEYQIEKN